MSTLKLSAFCMTHRLRTFLTKAVNVKFEVVRFLVGSEASKDQSQTNFWQTSTNTYGRSNPPASLNLFDSQNSILVEKTESQTICCKKMQERHTRSYHIIPISSRYLLKQNSATSGFFHSFFLRWKTRKVDELRDCFLKCVCYFSARFWSMRGYQFMSPLQVT